MSTSAWSAFAANLNAVPSCATAAFTISRFFRKDFEACRRHLPLFRTCSNKAAFMASRTFLFSVLPLFLACSSNATFIASRTFLLSARLARIPSSLCSLPDRLNRVSTSILSCCLAFIFASSSRATAPSAERLTLRLYNSLGSCVGSLQSSFTFRLLQSLLTSSLCKHSSMRWRHSSVCRRHPRVHGLELHQEQWLPERYVPTEHPLHPGVLPKRSTRYFLIGNRLRRVPVSLCTLSSSS
mmetsp:Transcript_31328/g.71522  ORF Transcript_31328/g.71522 Transcript_31328/m.71522 type:complete len:240 (+) Transcript_31328:548-1267(+)